MADTKGAIQEVQARVDDRKARILSGIREIREQLIEVKITMDEGIGQLVTMVDAHYAIAGTAALDNSLRAALLTKMRPFSRRMRDRLFEGYGPLATVAAKIDLAYALEIIPNEIYDQLKKIKHCALIGERLPQP